MPICKRRLLIWPLLIVLLYLQDGGASPQRQLQEDRNITVLNTRNDSNYEGESDLTTLQFEDAERYSAPGSVSAPEPEARVVSVCPGANVCVYVDHCSSTTILFQCDAGKVCCNQASIHQPQTIESSDRLSHQSPNSWPSHQVSGYNPAEQIHYAGQGSNRPDVPVPTTFRPSQSYLSTTQTKPDYNNQPPRPNLSGRPVWPNVEDQESTNTPTSAPSFTSPIPESPPPRQPPKLTYLHLLPNTSSCGMIQTENRITNGKNADLGQFPWMALLGYRIRSNPNVTYLCGGTLINKRYILTAAHCLGSQNRIVSVRLGELNLTAKVDCDAVKYCAPEARDYAVQDVIAHPEFNNRYIKHDIGLVRLAEEVPNYGEFIRPICLPVNISVKDDGKFTIAGWGKTDFNAATGSSVLQHTSVNGVNRTECNEFQPLELRPLAPGQMCAGGDKGKDACKGDSGGPLMLTLPAPDKPPRYITYQVGVVSYGPDSPCGIMPLPSIYTRVTTYLPWILETIRP